MADCSYARCKQERAAIRRELSSWSKDMVHIVGKYKLIVIVIIIIFFYTKRYLFKTQDISFFTHLSTFFSLFPFFTNTMAISMQWCKKITNT